MKFLRWLFGRIGSKQQPTRRQQNSVAAAAARANAAALTNTYLSTAGALTAKGGVLGRHPGTPGTTPDPYRNPRPVRSGMGQAVRKPTNTSDSSDFATGLVTGIIAVELTHDLSAPSDSSSSVPDSLSSSDSPSSSSDSGFSGFDGGSTGGSGAGGDW